MKSKAALAMKVLMLISLTVSISAIQAEEYQQVSSPASQETLRVSEGKSFVMNSNETIKRVSVTNDQIATAIVISPNQVLIHGLKAGTVSFLLWNEQEQVRAFDLRVLAVPMNLDPLRATLSKVLPGQDIRVSQSGSSIVLTGTVPSTAIADQAAEGAFARSMPQAGRLAFLLGRLFAGPDDVQAAL